MGLEDRDLPPEQLRAVNEPEPTKVEKIAVSMRAKGWDGRPLLVEEAVQGLMIYAWTGSHRIEAAKAAGLKWVPCMVITREVAGAVLDRLPDAVGFPSLRDALSVRANGGGAGDRDRLEALRQHGLAEAASVLEEELAAEEW